MTKRNDNAPNHQHTDTLIIPNIFQKIDWDDKHSYGYDGVSCFQSMLRYMMNANGLLITHKSWYVI